jgi:hypothetical protein
VCEDREIGGEKDVVAIVGFVLPELEVGLKKIGGDRILVALEIFSHTQSSNIIPL